MPISQARSGANQISCQGKCFQNPLRTASIWISSIITTNRNSTITAPTYTSTRAMARNSALQQQPDGGCLEEGQNQIEHRVHRVARSDDPEGCNSSTTENR